MNELVATELGFARRGTVRENTVSQVRPVTAGAGRGSLAWRVVAATAKLIALGLTLAFFAWLALAGPARAGSVLLADSQVIVGDQRQSFAIDVPSAGDLTITLTDLDWPRPFSQLAVEITSPTGVLESPTNAGSKTLSLSGAGTYYAYVTGIASGILDIGAYGLMAQFQPLVAVPLPASISLLLGGVAATFWYVRRRGGRSPGSPTPA